MITLSAVHVDSNTDLRGDGTAQFPFQTLGSALAVVAVNGTIHIAPGEYAEAVEITRAVTIEAMGGGVLLGQDQGGAETPSVTVTGTDGRVVLRDLGIVGLFVRRAEVRAYGLVLRGGEGVLAARVEAAEFTMSGGEIIEAPIGGILAVNSAVHLEDLSVSGASPFGIEFESGHLVITGSRVDDVDGVGVLSHGGEVTVARTTFVDCRATVSPDTGHAISLFGGSGVITSTDFDQIESRGVVVRSGQLQLVSCTFQDVGHTAVVLLPDSVGTAANGSVQSSNFHDVSTAIFQSGGIVEITGNTVSETRAAGVLVSDGGQVSVERNHFEDAQEGMISLVGFGDSIVRDNTCARAGAACIFASSGRGSLTVQDNALTACRASGISLSDVQDATLTGNVIGATRDDLVFGDIADGITAIDTNGRLEENQIHQVEGAAMTLLRFQGEVLGNTIRAGPRGGLVTDSGPERVILSDNQVRGIAGPGILILTSLASLTGNEVSESSPDSHGFGDGIALAADADALVGPDNLLRHCEKNGLVILDGVTAVVEGNNFKGNARYGVKVYCEGSEMPRSSVEIGPNQFQENRLGDVRSYP